MDEAVPGEGRCSTRCRPFIEQVYFLDVCAIGAMYPDWLGYGAGVTNYLSVPDLPLDAKGTQFDLPGGMIMNGDLANVQADHDRSTTRTASENVTESIAHAWYDGDWHAAPVRGGHRAEVHRLRGRRQVLVGQGAALRGQADAGRPARAGAGRLRARARADGAAGRPRRSRPPARSPKTKLTPAVLHSTLGRHARAHDPHRRSSPSWRRSTGSCSPNNIAQGRHRRSSTSRCSRRASSAGFGFHEAPRGTLSHWVVIDNGKITNYQAVVPSTWNAGPRDEKDQPGPYEASLVGNPVADAERPLEVIRTVHSFDPVPRLRDPHVRRRGDTRSPR